MPVTYKNRRDETYYLHETKTKTGKIRYIFSKKKDGKLVDDIPDGYEIYEHPSNAQVFLRKKKPRLLTDLEEHIVKKYLKKLNPNRPCIVDVNGEIITIFKCGQDPDEIRKSHDRILKHTMPSERESLIRWIVASTDYRPVLRFVLHDGKKREFLVEKFCSLGKIDDWIDIGGPDSIENLARKFIRHLGRESFYDLI